MAVLERVSEPNVPAELATVTPPEPVMAPAMTGDELLLSNVAVTPPAIEILRFALWVKLAPYCKVLLPVKVMFVAAVPGAVPSAESELMFKPPPLIVVPPEKVFAPVRVSVPLPVLSKEPPVALANPPVSLITPA